MSYGWKRTEILGALINGIFLISLAVYILLEIIPEIINPQQPPSGLTVIIIAGAGLIINTIATVVFHFTGQSHGHSHAGGGHGHSHSENNQQHVHSDDTNHVQLSGKMSHELQYSHLNDNKEEEEEVHIIYHSSRSQTQHSKKEDQNVKAVCLHYFGDMISSFFVLVMGIVITLFPPSDENSDNWIDYIDPITSFVIF